MTAQSGAIRAGAAYVEVITKPNVDPGLDEAKKKLENWQAGIHSQTAGQVKEGFARVASAVNMATPQFAEIGQTVSGLGAAMGVLQNILSGPIGWVSIAGAAAAAGLSMLFAKDSIGETTKSLQELEAAAALAAERLGHLSRNAGAGVTVWDTAANATGKLKKAQEELAAAYYQVNDAGQKLAAARKAYNALTQSQREAAVEDGGLKEATEAYADAYNKLTKAKILESKLRPAAEKLTAEEDEKKRTDKAREYIKTLEDEAFAIRATAEEVVRRKAAELQLTEAETARAVAAARLREKERALANPTKDPFDTTDDDRKITDQRREQIRQRDKAARDFAGAQNDEADRLEIQLSGRTDNEKKTALLELKHKQEVADLWGRGLGDTEAETALLSRQALETKLAQAELLKPQGATVAGTFSAWTAAGLGGAGNPNAKMEAHLAALVDSTKELVKEAKKDKAAAYGP